MRASKSRSKFVVAFHKCLAEHLLTRPALRYGRPARQGDELSCAASEAAVVLLTTFGESTQLRGLALSLECKAAGCRSVCLASFFPAPAHNLHDVDIEHEVCSSLCFRLDSDDDAVQWKTLLHILHASGLSLSESRLSSTQATVSRRPRCDLLEDFY
ncbi:hypothetical protein DOTSEDRAFT_82997, partial [Dothistroma septosporum NZE10]